MSGHNVVALFAVLIIGTAWAQQPTKKTTTQSCTFSEVLKNDGWAVPGVQDAKVKTPRTKLSNLPDVFVTVLQPVDAETYIVDIQCSREHPGRLEIDDLPIKIIDLWSFDFDNRVFAYRVHYEEEAIYNGKRGGLASASTEFFYDLDGSGRYILMRGSTPAAGLFAPSFIPDWVKKGRNPTAQ